VGIFAIGEYPAFLPTFTVGFLLCVRETPLSEQAFAIAQVLLVRIPRAKIEERALQVKDCLSERNLQTSYN
jgi:hypothetical protein